MSDIPITKKYRPRSLDEVVGQEVAVKSIKNAFESETLHHAYIFGGQFGGGKTSMARILAAMLNCSTGPTIKPCGVCKNCKEIFEGKSIDVKEIDAASNRSIDDIRALKDEIKYAPIDGYKKVIIIDEAHSLTGQAAEAALKMIEEPPAHVMFILCTTDTHLLKDTIHSRCVMFRFYKVAWMLLLEQLKKIADKEGIKYEEDALRICARTSSGSVRNALQNLQLLINYAGKGLIKLEDAKSLLGAIDENMYFKFVSAIVETKVVEAVKIVEQLLCDGRDAAHVVSGLYAHLRKLMITKTCQSELQSMGFTEEEVKRYGNQAGQSGLELILEMMTLTTDLNRGLKINMDPQILLEKYCVDSIIAKHRIERKSKQ